MAAMRIYVAATLPYLSRARSSGLVTEGPTIAYAVTPGLREWYAEGDLDELEYAAMGAAAKASLSLLADDPSAPRRRVVLAADVAENGVRPVLDGGRATLAQVSVAEPVPWSALASLHVDGYEAEPVVGEAANAVQGAADGDEDAQFAVDSAEDESLLWYAVQEADDLLQGGSTEPGSGRVES
ncbi:hypothetical protein acdb102_30200 [Acidothermaceae bacterium B102]|nr:hypothetical protein acdb102_30200 [Acidothermaceae bacterium B102]